MRVVLSNIGLGSRPRVLVLFDDKDRKAIYHLIGRLVKVLEPT